MYMALVAIQDESDVSSITGGKVVGLYKIPDKTDPVCPSGCKEAGWTRHLDGYIVHSCGRRRKGIRAQLSTALADWFGWNLLEFPPPLFRNPQDRINL